ncbi:AAA family ATPase, partial [Candidatus Mycalebacterium sp.]
MSEHFFKSIKIENFRGIESLKIDNLERINLFVGKNNCGKTTILESIYLLSGMS